MFGEFWCFHLSLRGPFFYKQFERKACAAMQEEARAARRKENNRISARNVRARNKEKLSSMEKEIDELKLQVLRLQASNRRMRLRGVVTIGPDDSTESFDWEEDEKERELKRLGIFIEALDNK